MYAKTNWAFDRQLNFYENETKPNQDWFCLIFCNFLIHGQYLKNDNILDFQPTIEEFESVTIFYGDILGFEDIVMDCTPTEVSLLNINSKSTEKMYEQ